MRVLCPVDGSDCSRRALSFATEFVRRYEGRLHVVHFTANRTDTTDQLLDDTEATLEEAGLRDAPEVVYDVAMSKPRYSNRVSKDILKMVAEEVRPRRHGTQGHRSGRSCDPRERDPDRPPGDTDADDGRPLTRGAGSGRGGVRRGA
jgi:hypothetical protein